jgi:hypothetical protein
VRYPIGLLAVACLLAAGCGEKAEPTATATARTATPTTAPAASPAPKGSPLRFSATDGVKLRGTLVRGRGRAPAVVLVHESDGGPSQFDDFVPALHQAGYAALTYTSRTGAGRLDETRNARDIAGAVRALRRHRGIDPKRIAVVGASIGAASAAYFAFTPLGRSTRAIVGLSPADFAGDPPKGRPHDVLLIADKAERGSADFIAKGSKGIVVRTSPVNGHGVALLPDARVRAWVLDWLAQRLKR